MQFNLRHGFNLCGHVHKLRVFLLPERNGNARPEKAHAVLSRFCEVESASGSGVENLHSEKTQVESKHGAREN